MKINVQDIKEDLGAFKEVKIEEEAVDIELEDREIMISEPAQMKFQIVNTDESFLVTGKIDLNLAVKCSRCLKAFDMQLNIEIEETVSKDRIEGGSEAVIDIEEEINDNIMVAIPMQPICDEECAGLCPNCGKNLNEGDCDCFMHTVDPRLAKLEELLDEE